MIVGQKILKQRKEQFYIIKENGDTFLIEVNDGWAIGNYGLSPDRYYSFVKNRWLQLTGILK